MTFTITAALTLGAIVEGILYGAYVVLFILYLVLRCRNNRAVDGLLTLAQILLFGLCTLFFCLDVSGDYFSIVSDAVVSDTTNKLGAGCNSLFAIIDSLAQMILLYRCWIIWDRRWRVVVVPGFLSVVSLGTGLTLVGLLGSVPSSPEAPTSDVFARAIQLGTATYIISLGVNALTTFLIVTKILLFSREVQPVLGPTGSHRSFRVVIAMLIESGLLIFVSQLVYVVLFVLITESSAYAFVQGPITQIYGITPTLLNIRVIMGSSYDNTTGMVSSLKFARPDGAATQTVQHESSSAASIHAREIGPNDILDNKRAAENAV